MDRNSLVHSNILNLIKMVKGAYTENWMSSYWYEYYGTRFTKQRR